MSERLGQHTERRERCGNSRVPNNRSLERVTREVFSMVVQIEMKVFLVCALLLLCLTSQLCALRCRISGVALGRHQNRHKLSVLSNEEVASQAGLPAALTVPTQEAEVLIGSTRNDNIAKMLGYVIGLGAMSLYAPIIANLAITKDSSGFSISTWVFNVLGSMLAISYPIKKRFSLSTYVELISGLLQGVVILGLVCVYQGRGTQYLQGMVPVLALFAAFITNDKVPDHYLKALQVLAIVVCTYANIPQIILTFQRGHASWSGITALLSTTGCIIRIFTTLQLTQDKLTLLGYSLALCTNAVLLGQVIWYNHWCKS